MARARVVLGEEDFLAAQAEGRKWDLQQALREAGAWLEQAAAAEGGERRLTASR